MRETYSELDLTKESNGLDEMYRRQDLKERDDMPDYSGHNTDMPLQPTAMPKGFYEVLITIHGVSGRGSGENLDKAVSDARAEVDKAKRKDRV